MKPARGTNIELLRIISMLMIIAHHYVYYGIQQNYQKEVANIVYQSGSFFRKLWASFLLPGGVVGVGIFFIIAGYFGIEQNKVSISKIVQPVTFYGLLGCSVYIILSLHNGSTITIDVIIKSLFPLGGSIYWFATVYLILMLVKSYLNGIIKSLSKGGLIILILLLLIEYSALRLINGHYLGLIEGVLYYFIGAFIKIRINTLKEISYLFYFIGFLISWFLYVFIDHLDLRWGAIISIVVFGTFCSVFIVLSFVTMKPFCNNYINKISKHSFGVYLFHEHILLREFLWSDLLRVESFQWKSKFFILLSLFCILSIYIMGCLFDCMAQKYIYTNIGIKVKKYLLRS